MAKKKHPSQKNNSSAKQTSKTGGPAKKQVHKNRGTLLTVLIVLIFVHAVLATYVGYSSLQDEYVRTSWVLPLLTLVSVVSIAGAVGMWYWKQWGIYLYAFSCVVQAAVHLAMTGSLLVVFYDLLPLSIVAYVISLQDKQKLFE